MIPEKLLREDRTLYSLHTRPDARWIKGVKEQCNEFHLNVYPDYGGGITEKDGEEVAKEIETRYNSYPALLEALQEAKNQIEYLHSKFQATGSGNAVISRIKGLLDGKKGKEAENQETLHKFGLDY